MLSLKEEEGLKHPTIKGVEFISCDKLKKGDIEKYLIKREGNSDEHKIYYFISQCAMLRDESDKTKAIDELYNSIKKENCGLMAFVKWDKIR